MTPNESASVTAMAAPVGVVNSAAGPSTYAGTRSTRRAVAGAGTGSTPCAACTVPLPEVERRANDALDAEGVEADRRADDIRDRVERADLVEVNLFERNVMSPSFDLAQAPKDSSRVGLYLVRQSALADHLLDRAERAMALAAAGRLDGHVRCRQPAALGCGNSEHDSFELQLRQLRAQQLEVKSGIDQGAQHHVPGNARETIEITDLHGSRADTADALNESALMLAQSRPDAGPLRGGRIADSKNRRRGEASRRRSPRRASRAASTANR